MKLIIVDDDAQIVKLLETYFARYGHEVVGKAYDGKSAMELVKSTDFDGIIVDYNLPDVSGEVVAKFTKRIKNDKKVVIITSLDDVNVEGFLVIRKKFEEFKKIIRYFSS